MILESVRLLLSGLVEGVFAALVLFLVADLYGFFKHDADISLLLLALFVDLALLLNFFLFSDSFLLCDPRQPSLLCLNCFPFDQLADEVG